MDLLSRIHLFEWVRWCAPVIAALIPEGGIINPAGHEIVKVQVLGLDYFINRKRNSLPHARGFWKIFYGLEIVHQHHGNHHIQMVKISGDSLTDWIKVVFRQRTDYIAGLRKTPEPNGSNFLIFIAIWPKFRRDYMIQGRYRIVNFRNKNLLISVWNSGGSYFCIILQLGTLQSARG